MLFRFIKRALRALIPITPVPTGIYFTAKIKHAEEFRHLQSLGYPVVSRWINIQLDESDPAAVANLWDATILEDLLNTTHLVIYLPEEGALKGGFIEIGAAWLLSHIIPGIHIHLVSPLDDATLRKLLGTIPQSIKVERWKTTHLKFVLDSILQPSRPA